MARNWLIALAVLSALVWVVPLAAQPPSQVKPVVPDPVPGAKPVTVERIKTVPRWRVTWRATRRTAA
jgi:hypothetical protein